MEGLDTKWGASFADPHLKQFNWKRFLSRNPVLYEHQQFRSCVLVTRSIYFALVNCMLRHGFTAEPSANNSIHLESTAAAVIDAILKSFPDGKVSISRCCFLCGSGVWNSHQKGWYLVTVCVYIYLHSSKGSVALDQTWLENVLDLEEWFVKHST